VSDTLLLGVDGGGTSTVAWLAAPGGKVLGRGKAGPSNAKAVGNIAARGALGDAIAAAFADASLTPVPVAAACFGLAGFDRAVDRKLLMGWAGEARWTDRLLLVNDGDLVVAAGTPEGWGVGVIAGTGSIAVGRAPDGRRARAGGWGHLIGDEGSAYAIVLAALRLVARRADGRDPVRPGGDPLTARLLRALGVKTPAEIVSVLYAPDFDRTRIAALAPVVLAAADEDPALVRSLLNPAAFALAEQVFAVARTLGLQTGELPLAIGGGFLLSSRALTDQVVANLGLTGLKVIATPVPEPVRGAIVLAEQGLGQT
jgi:N-acetylglucosamine kinase-like BadF-type ATPase